MPSLQLAPVGSVDDAKSALSAIGVRFVLDPRLADKQGLINSVYLVDTLIEGTLAVKVNRDPLFFDTFKKEKVCADRARITGVPTPEVLASGRTETTCFIISRAVAGQNAAGFGKEEILSVFRKLGEWARTLHTIPCGGFGEDAATIASPVAGAAGVSWLDWCESEYLILVEEGEYEMKGLLTEVDLERFRNIFGQLRALTPMRAVLAHGDLSHENVMVSEGGLSVLLDWGSGLGCTGLSFDLAPVSMWQSAARYAAFLEGYCLPPAEYEARLHEIRVVKVWYGLRMLQWMTSDPFVLRRGGKVDPERIARLMQVCNPWIDECLTRA